LKARITPFRVAVGLFLALVMAVVILLRPSGELPYSTMRALHLCDCVGQYLLFPDRAHPVAPLVHVAGSKPPKGGGELFFVDVQERPARELDVLFPSLNPHSTLVPTSDLVPPGSTAPAYLAAELREMATSQKIAAAVALRRLGYHVDVRNNGVLVNQIILGTDAAGKLQPTDVIVSVNGQPTPVSDELRAAMAKVKPGQTVTLRILRGNTPLTERIRTVDEGGRALIGFSPAQSAEIKLPIKVAIDSGNIGGPSAGLPFTLEVLRRLGQDVTHGYRVAATGEMNLDGTVGPIGGIEQKTWGAREAGAQVFLVPKAGDNARDARKFAGSKLKIIPVTSFEQALHALTSLPKLPQK
jgi:PDZ domain-containing protein